MVATSSLSLLFPSKYLQAALFSKSRHGAQWNSAKDGVPILLNTSKSFANPLHHFITGFFICNFFAPGPGTNFLLHLIACALGSILCVCGGFSCFLYCAPQNTIHNSSTHCVCDSARSKRVGNHHYYWLRLWLQKGRYHRKFIIVDVPNGIVVLHFQFSHPSGLPMASSLARKLPLSTTLLEANVHSVTACPFTSVTWWSFVPVRKPHCTEISFSQATSQCTNTIVTNATRNCQIIFRYQQTTTQRSQQDWMSGDLCRNCPSCNS